MKYLPSSAAFLSCLATAACLAAPIGTASAADPYRKDTHGPRIGTRILLFVKDLAYGDNPNDRYRHLPKNQDKQQQRPPQRPPGMPPQQVDPGIRPPGQRYSLDRPPIPGETPPSQPPPHMAPPQDAPPQNAIPPRDLPADSQDAPPAEWPERRPPSPVEGHNDDAAPVKIKPRVTPPAPKPAASPKIPLEDAPPKPTQPREPAAPQAPAPQTLTASNSSGASKKSWQTHASDAPAPSAPTPPPLPPSVQTTNSEVSTLPMNVNSATLTGSKTGKDGRVKSPYPPFNELDVTGLPAGSLAMDPTTGKVFRVP